MGHDRIPGQGSLSFRAGRAHVLVTEMNPAYAHVRFRAVLPAGGLPERFGIVTACNPDGIDSPEADNQAATLRLQSILADEGLTHFPVTGGSPDFTHAEPGFGILATRERCLALGREFRQEAVFWIEHGDVYLCPCSDLPSRVIGTWTELAIGT